MRRTRQQARSGSQSSRSRLPTPLKRTKPSVSIIGAGRVGLALGLAMKRAGYQIEIVAAKHPASARRSAKLLGDNSVGISATQFNRPSKSVLKRLRHSTLVILATPDDMIAQVAGQLAQALRSIRTELGKGPSRQVALHTSGVLSAEDLQPLRQIGFSAGSFHPLLSISDPVAGANSLREAFFAVEGDALAIRLSRSLASNIGARSFTIPAGTKALYHAAALTASPNLVALFDIALEMLGRCGLSRRQARKVLLPLVQSTLTNLSRQDPAQALTGPFRRGDAATVRKHVSAMRSADLRDALAAYALLGRRSLRLTKSHGERTVALSEIARILSSIPKNRISNS